MRHMTLVNLAALLKKATTPEEVFGRDAAQAEAVYRQLVKVAHPDVNPSASKKAQEAFVHLQSWWVKAQHRLAAGIYGTTAILVSIATKTNTFTITRAFARGDLANLYQGERWVVGDNVARSHVLLKVAREPGDGEFLKTEVATLKALRKDDHFQKYLPTPIEMFTLDGRQGTAFEWLPDLVSLTNLRAAYPDGLDPRDMAWIFKRLLAIVGHAGNVGYVHGGITPDHCLVRLSDHGLVLCGWGASVATGHHVRLASTRWLKLDEFYPPELRAKRPAVPASDIYMAASTALWLMGDRTDLPTRLMSFLGSCLLAAPSRRPHDAWDLHEDFDLLLRRLYGPPRFRPLSMPAAARA